MRRLKNYIVGVDKGSVVLFSDYENDGEMWTGEGARLSKRVVTFSEPFKTPPVVHVSISMWDMDETKNQRADIAAEMVGTKDFELVFRTWGDSRVARIRADWMAIGELFDEDEWQLY